MTFKEQFGARLREARQKTGKTQKIVASELNVTSTLLSDIEKGRRTTTAEKLSTLCKIYNVSADYILGLVDEPKALTDEQNREN